jgi:hypothetical protein
MKQSLALTAAGIVGIALAAWARPGIAAVEDLTAADVRSTLTRDTVRQSIENGIVDETTKKTRMKGYKDKFSPDEIDALVTHVLGLAGPAK